MKLARRFVINAIEKELELKFHPGAFVYGDACTSFVEGLVHVREKIDAIAAAYPASAASLYETFIVGCYEKAKEIHEEYGEFGAFVQTLFARWTQTRQKTNDDPSEIVKNVLRLIDNDPSCLCDRIDVTVAKAFNKRSRNAFIAAVQGRIATLQADTNRDNPDNKYKRRRMIGYIYACHIEARDIASYIALAEAEGITPKECLAIARMLEVKRPKEAILWTERGRGIEDAGQVTTFYGGDITTLHRSLLIKLGRRDEAVEDAWRQYHEHPCTHYYDDLMRLAPKSERSKWHTKAMHALENADAAEKIELFVATHEYELLKDLISLLPDDDLEGLSHFKAEPAARKLEGPHPYQSARIYRAQCMRILIKKKSQYYNAALSYMRKARLLFEKSGHAADWEFTIRAIREQHGRKHGFMRGFEDIVTGEAMKEKPSFLATAKARWPKGRTSIDNDNK